MWTTWKASYNRESCRPSHPTYDFCRSFKLARRCPREGWDSDKDSTKQLHLRDAQLRCALIETMRGTVCNEVSCSQRAPEAGINISSCHVVDMIQPCDILRLGANSSARTSKCSPKTRGPPKPSRINHKKLFLDLHRCHRCENSTTNDFFTRTWTRQTCLCVCFFFYSNSRMLSTVVRKFSRFPIQRSRRSV